MQTSIVTVSTCIRRACFPKGSCPVELSQRILFLSVFAVVFAVSLLTGIMSDEYSSFVLPYQVHSRPTLGGSRLSFGQVLILFLSVCLLSPSHSSFLLVFVFLFLSFFFSLFPSFLPSFFLSFLLSFILALLLVGGGGGGGGGGITFSLTHATGSHLPQSPSSMSGGSSMSGSTCLTVREPGNLPRYEIY